MIRCVRMWTGEDGNSLFEEGTMALGEGERGDFIGKPSKAKNISFRETASGGIIRMASGRRTALRHHACGHARIRDEVGAHFTIRPGDILIAEDNRGSGHSGG